jgi:hypothetical protein
MVLWAIGDPLSAIGHRLSVIGQESQVTQLYPFYTTFAVKGSGNRRCIVGADPLPLL